ncbi:hypothetical protein [Bacillus sp. AK128]
MRLRRFLGGMFFMLLLTVTGCSNALMNENKQVENEFPPSMTGVIISNGIEHEMEAGSFEWERKKGIETEVIQTDHASPYQMADHLESIKVNPNQKIEIKVEEDPNIKVYLWDEKGRGKEIEQDDFQIMTPSTKGKYIYEVLAEWKNGTISYTFVIDVP